MSSINLTNLGSQREDAEERVAKIAWFLRIGTGCVLAMHVVMLVGLAAWLIWGPIANDDFGLLDSLHLSNGEIKLSIHLYEDAFTLRTKLLVSTFFVVLVSYSFYCFSKMHGLYGNFCDYKIFTAVNSRLLRSLGYALILGALIHFGLLIAISVMDILDLHDTSLKEDLDTDADIFLKAMVIGLVFLSAWVLDIGRELHTGAKFTI